MSSTVSLQYFPQMLQIFESCAGELGPDNFDTYSLPYLKDIAYDVKLKLKRENIEAVPMVILKFKTFTQSLFHSLGKVPSFYICCVCPVPIHNVLYCSGNLT